MAKKTKTKGKKAEQLKIAGTGRIDVIDVLEKQGTKYVRAREERQSQQEREEAEQLKLTDLLKEHGLDRYVFEDQDGEKLEIYIPAESKAKVRRLKVDRPDGDAE